MGQLIFGEKGRDRKKVVTQIEKDVRDAHCANMQNDAAVICSPLGLARYYPLLEDFVVKRKKGTTNIVGLSWFIYHDLLMLGWFHSARPREDYSRGPSWILTECIIVYTSKTEHAHHPCVTTAQMYAWKFTPTFMWNSRFSFMANICSKMSSEIRGMIPIPWGSWRFPYEKKETR